MMVMLQPGWIQQWRQERINEGAEDRKEADDGDEEQFKTKKISCEVMNSLYTFHLMDGNNQQPDRRCPFLRESSRKAETRKGNRLVSDRRLPKRDQQAEAADLFCWKLKATLSSFLCYTIRLMTTSLTSFGDKLFRDAKRGIISP